METLKQNKIIIIVFFFIIYLFVGFIIYQDYGIGIEEHFQRQNGFYWLKNLSNLFHFDKLFELSNNEYLKIRSEDPSLPNSEFFNFYGIIFDTPLAFLEVFFNLEKKFAFELRHFFIFFIFFISSLYFFLILKNRFNNLIITFIGTFLYIFTPRIFGDSFHNNKDILFLSLLTISIFYLFKIFENNKLKNIILFSLFAALASSSRIMGVFLPFLYFVFLLVEYFSKKIIFKDLIKKITLLFFFYIFFLFLHFPYFWELKNINFIDWFNVFFYNMGLKILFNGEYYNIKYLPRLYLPTWIVISSPVYILLPFFYGYFLILKRFLHRLLKIKFNTQIIYSDLWRSINEKKDLFIFISITIFLIYAIFFNVAMLSGWRHFYFLHLFLIYICVFGLYVVFLNIKKKKLKKKLFYFVNIIFAINLIYQIYVYHPYQSLYFNSFVSKSLIKKFPVDTPSLSRSDAIKYILSIKKKETVNIANASWTPLYNGKDIILKKNFKNLNFVGQDYINADYIYTNYIYELNPKFNNKYNIDKEFKEIKEFKIKNLLIYKIYEKIN